MFIFNIGPELRVWHRVETVGPQILSMPPAPAPHHGLSLGTSLLPPSVTVIRFGIFLFSQVSPGAYTHLVTFPLPLLTSSLGHFPILNHVEEGLCFHCGQLLLSTYCVLSDFLSTRASQERREEKLQKTHR